MKHTAMMSISAVTMLLVLWFLSPVKPTIIQSSVTYDTVYSTTVIHETVTVISRAADTVRIVTKNGGTLSEQDLVRLVCPKKFTFGDERDVFWYSVAGILFCPGPAAERAAKKE